MPLPIQPERAGTGYRVQQLLHGLRRATMRGSGRRGQGRLQKLASHSGAIQQFLARGGTASLTAYLLPSFILSFVFLEYGLGLYQQTSAGAAILIALVTALLSLILCSLWLRRFRRGPVEILLRRWTYLGATPAKHP